jgi:hypothetical protein
LALAVRGGAQVVGVSARHRQSCLRAPAPRTAWAPA